MKSKYNYVVLNFYVNFRRVGGAEKVAVELSRLLAGDVFSSKIMGLNKFEENNKFYNITNSEYLRFSFFRYLTDGKSVIISNHRKLTTLLLILKKIFRLKTRIIHVSHNEFFNLQRLTLFPKDIVAVSEKVKQNLIKEFKVKPQDITVIHNGIHDPYLNTSFVGPKLYNTNEIKILYPARINTVKGQIRLVNALKDQISKSIIIDFAGEGEDSDSLEKLIEGDFNFRYLGHVDIGKVMVEYDYVMLFSENEGLPLSLIEATSYGKPIICNSVGGNEEIVVSGVNGYVVNEYEKLIDLINYLDKITMKEYKEMCYSSRNQFEQFFSEKEMLDKYKDLILNKS
ncbi:glycosyltransferase family 4 protein [Sphingobacterium multivorum]|uniref:UDP-D-galactose:(Glucosyl)lipopolysaccharide-1,6-D-galactosyltransferase n=1 Tax=Sphingobacterium multivorum TaxID=28454 RepID=A0A2X2J985_SPHMU|nr:glycosyltransferase family 4 protein [Sphingobacterium multivorum]QRQ61207.1 glycosyltransferase family 4 protein [Sphingobacterium multivorum]SPZ88476.1 UDP-D-galactose:(glucosyl)lipopolysaccharide-1,6-D-galactosyltransferase [Sphingobacterium multivorum]